VVIAGIPSDLLGMMGGLFVSISVGFVVAWGLAGLCCVCLSVVLAILAEKTICRVVQREDR
jgi:membrane protein implicated in regulation of membrane protease activity